MIYGHDIAEWVVLAFILLMMLIENHDRKRLEKRLWDEENYSLQATHSMSDNMDKMTDILTAHQSEIDQLRQRFNESRRVWDPNEVDRIADGKGSEAYHDQL